MLSIRWRPAHTSTRSRTFLPLRRRGVRSACRAAAAGCTCGSACRAATSGAATPRPNGTRARTSSSQAGARPSRRAHFGRSSLPSALRRPKRSRALTGATDMPYVDSSVLVKLYVCEPDSATAERLLLADPVWASAAHTEVEVRRTLSLRPPADQLGGVKKDFARDWARLAVVALDDTTCRGCPTRAGGSIAGLDSCRHLTGSLNRRATRAARTRKPPGRGAEGGTWPVPRAPSGHRLFHLQLVAPRVGRGM